MFSTELLLQLTDKTSLEEKMKTTEELFTVITKWQSGMGRLTTIHVSLIFRFFKYLPFCMCLAYVSSETWLHF